jgi:hypothetical protein
MLGHSSIVLTADTYTKARELPPEPPEGAGERVVTLVVLAVIAGT